LGGYRSGVMMSIVSQQLNSGLPLFLENLENSGNTKMVGKMQKVWGICVVMENFSQHNLFNVLVTPDFGMTDYKSC